MQMSASQSKQLIHRALPVPKITYSTSKTDRKRLSLLAPGMTMRQIISASVACSRATKLAHELARAAREGHDTLSPKEVYLMMVDYNPGMRSEFAVDITPCAD